MNVFPRMAPSITYGAVIPLWRRAPTKVIVFQCPCGTRPTRRSPRAQRPLSRTIFVLAAVSSMNTSRAGSNMPCARIQRRRTRATSARSCSAARRLFFEGHLVALEEEPDRGATAGNPLLAHRTNHLVQRQVRLLRNQPQQKVRVLLQGRRAPTPRLRGATPSLVKALHPYHRHTGADLVVFSRLAPRRAAFDPRDDPFANIRRISLRHHSASQNRINADRLAYPWPLGNPPIQLGRNML